MATVYIPSLLRNLTGGQETVSAEGNTVREIIEYLQQKFPGFQARICQDDMLRPGLAVVVDGQLSPLGLLQPALENSEVHFIPAIAGGSNNLRV